MANADYIPERGDIAWMLLDPRVGHEQFGRRPVIVLSHKKLAEHTNLAVISPITSKIIGLPFEVVLTDTKTTGAILPIHIKSVDFRKRKAVFIEKAPDAILEKTIKSIQNLIVSQ
jgi:mRNA interferase MazF